MNLYSCFAISQIVAGHILYIWLLLLILIVALAWRFGRAQDDADRGSSADLPYSPSGLIGRPSLVDWVSGAALLIFLAGYIFAIFYKEDFSYYDNDQFTDFSVRGMSLRPPVWPGLGRFVPLAYQEFNFLRFLTRTPFGYHCFAVLQLLIVLALLWTMLKDFKVRYRVLILSALLLAPSFLISFTGLIYPERNLLFWLTVLLFCLHRYSKNTAPIYFVGCLVAVHFALYYKEPLFILVTVYAGSRLLLDIFGRGSVKTRSLIEIARQNALNLGMIGVSALYVLLFALSMGLHRRFAYVAALRTTWDSALLAYLKTDWLPFILLVVLIVRLVRFGRQGHPLDHLWDALALGAVAYFGCILALGMVSGYYTAPVDLVAILYLAKVLQSSLSAPSMVRLSAITIVLTLVLANEFAYSLFRVVERKHIVMLKGQLAEFLGHSEPRRGGQTIELFFPYANSYHLMGISSYLRYKGLQLAGDNATGRDAGPQFVIEGPGEFAGNKCIEYREYACAHADSPGPGALVVILPDDNVSATEVEKARHGAIQILSLKPCLGCIENSFWFRSLHAISPEFWDHQLPGHWLQLDIFKKTA